MARERTPISAAQLAVAARRSKAGVPMREIARDLGLDRRTLARRLEQEAPDNEAEPLDREAEVDAALDREAAKAAKRMGLTGSPDEQRARLLETIDATQRIIDELTAAGEYAEARKHQQVKLTAENVLRAVNKTDDPTEIKVTRAQLVEAEKAALATMARYAEARPQCCARCSRQLSIAWAEGAEE